MADGTIDGSESGTSFNHALYFMQCGFKLYDTMIYEKSTSLPCKGAKRYYQIFEYMFVFTKGKPKATPKGKEDAPKAQEAHEAIRPTHFDLEILPEAFNSDYISIIFVNQLCSNGKTILHWVSYHLKYISRNQHGKS